MTSALPSRFDHSVSRAAGLLVLVLAVTLQGAAAQDASPTAPADRPAEATPEPPPANPGLLNTLGGWIRDSADGVTAGLKGTQQRLDDLNKGTLDTLTRLPSAGMVTGRALCQMASNGAPDCYAAAETLCKEKGFSTGKSLLTESAEKCSARVLLPGYKRKDGDCRINTFVTRASCG